MSQTTQPGRLTHCPVCGYDLTGLPAAYRCPECDYAYDERTRVWYPCRRPGIVELGPHVIGILLTSLGLTTLVAFVLLNLPAVRSPGRILSIAAAVFLVMVAIGIMVAVRRNPMRLRCVVIDDEGVILSRHAAGEHERIAWKELAPRPPMVMEGPFRPVFSMLSPQDRDQFEREITARWVRRDSTDDDGPPQPQVLRWLPDLKDEWNLVAGDPAEREKFLRDAAEMCLCERCPFHGWKLRKRSGTRSCRKCGMVCDRAVRWFHATPRFLNLNMPITLAWVMIIVWVGSGHPSGAPGYIVANPLMMCALFAGAFITALVLRRYNRFTSVVVDRGFIYAGTTGAWLSVRAPLDTLTPTPHDGFGNPKLARVLHRLPAWQREPCEAEIMRRLATANDVEGSPVLTGRGE
jgi:hypothetical protein